MIQKDKTPAKMKLWKKVVLTFVILILLIIIAAGILAYAGSKDDAPPVVEANTDIYLALASAGLKDVVVDVTDKHVIIAYELEDVSQKNSYVFLALGAAYQTAPDVKTIIITQFKELQVLEEITVPMADVTAFAEGQIGEEELRNRFVVSS